MNIINVIIVILDMYNKWRNEGCEMIICKGLDISQQIKTVDDWKQKCPPAKRDGHWCKGKSAMSLADYWINYEGKDMIESIQKHESFRNLTIDICSPEHVTRFDSYSKGRVHDLVAIGQSGDDKVCIAVEAKVNEGFGNGTAKAIYDKAVRARQEGVSTDLPDRIIGLVRSIFIDPEKREISDLQYQLLYAVAGTLAEAKNNECSRAVFFVHTFETNCFEDKDYERNKKALKKLVDLLSKGTIKEIEEDKLYGPFTVPGSDYIPRDAELYIGHIKSKI